MDNIIETRNAADAPMENVSVPVESSGVETAGGADNLFSAGNDAIAQEGLPVGQTVPVQGDSETPLQTQEPVQTEAPAKEDPSRMQYWQSQTDQAKNEAVKLKQELDYYQNTLGPIAKAIEQNPQVLDNIEGLNNGDPRMGNAQQVAPKRNSLEKPQRPEKPHSYNEVDAYNDPESDSFKYRMSNDQWRDNMLQWYEDVDVARQQHQQAVAREQQKVNMIQNAHNTAISAYGLSVDQANEFVQWAQNPSNITLDSLVKLYQMKNAPSPQQMQAQAKTQEMKTQQERLKVPRPTTVQNGQSAPVQTEEDSFNAALLANGRR